MNDMKPNQSMMLAGVSMIRTFLFLSLFLFCGEAMAQKKTINIFDDVLGSSVGKVEIVHIPYHVVKKSGISPDELEKNYSYKFTAPDYTYNRFFDVLKETNVVYKNNSEAVKDVRWGVTFYDRDGKRIVSLYLDRSGKNGYINSTPVTFSSEANKGLFWWLEGRFLEAFK